MTGQRGSRTILLSGVGGDSHSVGLIILNRALKSAGFTVDFMSTQNSTSDICARAGDLRADAVLISNMDGHAPYYLRDLPDMRALHDVEQDTIWYLGGHPSLTGDEAAVAELCGLGFQRVFLGYTEPAHVISCLDEDLAARPAGTTMGPARHAARRRVPAPPAPAQQSLEAQRELVLSQWATGHQARNLEENARICAQRGSLSAAQATADRVGRTLIHPRTGVSGLQEQIDLFDALRTTGAEVLSLQIDSLTRNNQHEQVELLLKESTARLDSFHGLNGFPLVNHGVTAGRHITSLFSAIPFQVRHSTRDPRLLAEITYASGITAYEGGALTYNLPYYRDYSPRESIQRWRYVDQLTGLYHRRFGVVIDREFFGVLTATLVPACVAASACVLEALLAAEAGVKSVSLGYAEQGNRAQDIGAIHALRRVGRHYLDRRGHEDVAVFAVFHQYMAAFPADEEKARAVLHGSAVTARLSGASRLMLKTMVESSRIPSAQQNADSLVLVRSALDAQEAPPVPAEAAAEEELIVRETCAIIDAVLALDAPDLGERVAMAVDRGIFDIPFSPNIWNAGRAVPVRDTTGAVRFADPGAIPLPDDVRQFHRDAVRRRLRRDGGDVNALLQHDVLRTARGDFEEWPLKD
ncbi:methylaspartate mutase subunit E [Streptomyces albus]|uniref:methylaspartate mutase subunit E n=1 Tax=Streptomyces sp. NRRL F-5917 TaxID=1463873 RepID=UPI00068E7699|nr:methylaspartate mutase subunit E [Streptomyces sp. NRRL F-5917]